MDDDESDYDVELVLADDAAPRTREYRGTVDLTFAHMRDLIERTLKFGWWSPDDANLIVLFDRSGEVAKVVERLSVLPEDKALADAPGWFEAYLNSFYRSMKAWRRGNEIGGRISAAYSLTALAGSLFALERRWPPYPDRLYRFLDRLDGQGWEPGWLAATYLDILRNGSPALQQELEGRAEEVLATHGFPDLTVGWAGEIERVKAFRF